MVPDTVPQSFLTEFVTVWNGNGPHKAFIGLRARGLLEHVLRRPIYELWATTLGAYPSVVEVGLELGHFVGAGVHGGGAGDAVVVIAHDYHRDQLSWALPQGLDRPSF